jgi:hypothetical protein
MEQMKGDMQAVVMVSVGGVPPVLLDIPAMALNMDRLIGLRLYRRARKGDATLSLSPLFHGSPEIYCGLESVSILRCATDEFGCLEPDMPVYQPCSMQSQLLDDWISFFLPTHSIRKISGL